MGKGNDPRFHGGGSENNPPLNEEALKKLRDAMDREADPLGSFKQAAQQQARNMMILYKAFMAEGFTSQQAMEVVINTMVALCRPNKK